MNILIIRLSSVGDVVHTLPAVPLLKKNLPGCHITWVVEEAAAELLRGYEGIDELLVSRRKTWLRLVRAGQVGVLREVRDCIQNLRSTHYELVLDFQGLFKSGMLAGLARAQRKIGFSGSRECATLFYTEQAPAPAFNAHAIQRHMGLLRHLGISDEAIRFSPLWGPEEEKSIERLLAETGAAGPGPLVAVHPVATWPTKCWDGVSLASVCDSLHRDFAARLVFTGTEQERGAIAAVTARMAAPAVNLAGRTTLRELACLLGGAQLVVAMDSGPLHLACAAGAPVVALFGPTAPWRTGPFGSRCQVIRQELACSPCYKRKSCPLGHHQCMTGISAAEVLAACAQYLGEGCCKTGDNL